MTTLGRISPVAGASLYQSNQESESQRRRAQQNKPAETSTKVSFSTLYRKAIQKGE